jgi:NAD(P)-dependent dehydrogenase (short-subunit alcohol dehydrogenase family)
MKPFEGKVAIVTGGGSGIGQALCEELAHRGSMVVVADINDDCAQQVATAITQRGGRAYAAHINVSKKEEVRQLVAETVSAYGHLDYLFNNAGIVIGGDARDLTSEQWHRVLDVNFYGALYGTLAAYSVMLKQGSGHIVNTASAAGLLPGPGNAPYSASKHAIVGLSLSLRFEAADLGVKVSVICPGFVRTNISQSMVLANAARQQFLARLPFHMMKAEHAAHAILGGVLRNQAIIVFPTSMRWIWRLYRAFPHLLDGVWLTLMREFRTLRGAPDIR